MRRSIGVLLALSAAGLAGERVEVRDSGGLGAAAARAEPGSVLSLAPGVYAPGVRLVGLAGAKDRPIVIEGADAARAPVFRGGSCAIHLVDCRFVTLRNLRIEGCSGNGINVDDGGTVESPAHHVVLENITVLDTGPRGNHDGIKLSGVDDFVLRGCRVAGWGGSAVDMVGCHSGIVEACTFEGKRGFSQSSGIQMKGGSRAIKVRGCFFRDAGQRAVNLGGSTGLAYFRPHDAPFEADGITIEGNRFTGSEAFVAFVNARQGRVRRNTFHLPGKWVFRVLQESNGGRFPPCREGVFEYNLIVYDARLRTAANVGPGTAPETFVVRNNAWFGLGGAARPRSPLEEKDAIHGVDPRLADAGQATMRPTSKDPRLADVGARAD